MASLTDDNILIQLKVYLKETDIFKVLLPIIDEYIRYTLKTNKELKQAVDKRVKIKTFQKKYGF